MTPSNSADDSEGKPRAREFRESAQLAFIKLDVDAACEDRSVASTSDHGGILDPGPRGPLGSPSAQQPLASRPIIILHGLFGSSANWRTLARSLTAAHCIYLVDARNHGRSQHTPTMTYEEQAGDLAEFVTRHNIEHPVVLGHSMGGKTAMLFALAYPELLDGLIVIDIAPVNYPSEHHHGALIQAMLNLPARAMINRGTADAALASAVSDPGLRAFLLHNLTRDESGLRWRINLPVLRDSLTVLRTFPALGPGRQSTRFRKPTLFLSGGASTYVRQEHHRDIVRRFPEASFDVIPGAGHWVHAEQPRAVSRSVQRFLDLM